jgi:hypothetical protein
MASRAAVAALSLLLAGCGGHGAALVDASVHVPADQPPPASQWPRYPSFASASCWTRRLGGRPLQAAPSFALPPRPRFMTPAEIARRVLAGLGDRRYVLRVALGPPPPVALHHIRGYFAGVRPPADALWAYVGAPAAGRTLVAQWETALVVGALRDDFCAAGGRPLVGWTVGHGGIGVSDNTQALEQRFPSPSPATFRNRVRLVGRRYGFHVRELRLLRARQVAPLLVVQTDRDRKEFVHDVPAIMGLLDPTSTGPGRTAVTFEGFFLEARDDHGAFVRVENVYRGETEGGEWSWNRCIYPYPHSEPFGTKSCP